jgi:hypothetical protein
VSDLRSVRAGDTSARMSAWMRATIAATVAMSVACGASRGGDAHAPTDDASAPDADAAAMTLDSGMVATDGGPATEAGAVRADRFITKVVSFTPGPCSGFGSANMPGVVMGPPVGGGASMGSTDVVSLGNAGEIVVSFEPNAIVDGPGADLLVFENAFYPGGDPTRVYAEPGEVSVSDDGVTWTTFPCTATSYPYGSCAGWHAVFSNPSNGISPIDPAVAGGDPFDLADVGITRARYVRVRDKTHEDCPTGSRINTNGFDLDAMAIVNAQIP